MRTSIRFAAGLVALSLLLTAHGASAVGEPVNGFPNWAERVIHEWMNRARIDPQLEMTACGSPCVERACYSVLPPLSWNLALNRAARFHSDELVRQGYFAHDSACTVVANISSLYPESCNGAAACACVGGTRTCAPTCSSTWQRIQLFGASGSGEIIASPSDPNYAFYLWLFEQGDTSACQFTSRNGHRFLILKSTGAVGTGVAGYSTGDFGPGSAPTKIPSAAHYPQQAASVEVWANWYDAAGPASATVNVEGTCTAMSLRRGTATNGAWSATVTGAASGCHRYFVSFVDGSGTTVTYPTTGSLAIGSGAGCPDWDIARPAACGAAATLTPSPSPTPSPLPPTATPSRTPSPTPSATPTFTPTRTATSSPTPSSPPTSTPSALPTDTPTPSPSSPPTTTATPDRHDLSGAVLYYGNAAPVSQALVHVTGATTATSSPTDTAGNYALTDLPTEDLTVYPDKVGDAGTAISALDAAFVLQSLVGLRELSTPQQLACDVTANGNLSALDASLILQHTVGLFPRFPAATACNSDWAFLPDAASGPVPIPPAPAPDTCTPGGLTYRPLDASFTAQSFRAVLFGDCTGNWQPAGGGAAAHRAARSSASVRAGPVRPLRSGRVVLPIFVESTRTVAAIEMRVDYEATALRVISVRAAGGARGAVVATNARQPGVVRIGVARAQPIAAGNEPVAVLLFETQGRGTAPSPTVSGRLAED